MGPNFIHEEVLPFDAWTLVEFGQMGLQLGREVAEG